MTDMPLDLASAGKDYLVSGIQTCGRCKGARKRLTEMGFLEGAAVRILNSHGRSVLVDLDGTRYAVSRGLAKKVRVKGAEK